MFLSYSMCTGTRSKSKASYGAEELGLVICNLSQGNRFTVASLFLLGVLKISVGKGSYV